jgi:hypothetical protein
MAVMTNESINDGPAPARSAVPEADKRYVESAKRASKSELRSTHRRENFV